jgi:hypothetical protein
MRLCLAELAALILKLNRIASRRRFMRDRILDIAQQMLHVRYCVAWCHKEDNLKTVYINNMYINRALDEVQEDLVRVIGLKKCMRRELCAIWYRIRTVKSNLFYGMYEDS